MPSILVVDDEPDVVMGMVELLGQAGYQASGAVTFQEAKNLLAVTPPDMLIADVRLGAFNGLQLVMQGRLEHPSMSAIIITGYQDPVLEAEARREGADYLTKPVDPAKLLKLIPERLQAKTSKATFSPTRRWPRKLVTGPVDATVAGAAIRVVDMSYGGLRFEMIATTPQTLPSTFALDFPTLGLSVVAHPVWTNRSGQDETSLRCGAALSDPDPRAERAWRGLVDALPGS